MFNIYYKIQLDKCRDEYKGIDYGKLSEYEIGRKLGLTKKRVSNLAEKCELRFGKGHFEWKSPLKKLLADPKRVNVQRGIVRITIPNQSLFNAIQENIENEGGIVDIQLNGHLLQVSTNDLLLLICRICDNDEEQMMIKAVKQELEKNNALQKVDDLLTLVKKATEIGVDITQILANLTNPTASVLSSLAVNLIDKLKK